jgi:hypothetical protein
MLGFTPRLARDVGQELLTSHCILLWPRGQVVEKANDQGNRAAARDLGIRKTRRPPLRLTPLLCGYRCCRSDHILISVSGKSNGDAR